MSIGTQQNATHIALILDAVEQRDRQTLASLYHPKVEFHFPAALPYGGCHTGTGVAALGERFASIWDPLQPTAAYRKLDYRLVAASDDEVVARYFLKGRNHHGRTIASDTLARYTMRDGLLIRAQMYHYELDELLEFLRVSRQCQ